MDILELINKVKKNKNKKEYKSKSKKTKCSKINSKKNDNINLFNFNNIYKIKRNFNEIISGQKKLFNFDENNYNLHTIYKLLLKTNENCEDNLINNISDIHL